LEAATTTTYRVEDAPRVSWSWARRPAAFASVDAYGDVPRTSASKPSERRYSRASARAFVETDCVVCPRPLMKRKRMSRRLTPSRSPARGRVSRAPGAR
jgi:hypothetical protein